MPPGLCTASCTICNGQQISGYDTYVTRRYNMRSSIGSFQFDYETYVIKDRITVWNGGRLIFNIGCVGAFHTVDRNYSNHSSSIRVDVEPNCDCVISTGCGTLCHFTVHCLNSTIGSRCITDNNQITSVLSGKADIENRLCVN